MRRLIASVLHLFIVKGILKYVHCIVNLVNSVFLANKCQFLNLFRKEVRKRRKGHFSTLEWLIFAVAGAIKDFHTRLI